MIFVNNEAILLSILISLLKYFSSGLCKIITNLSLLKRESAEYKRLFNEIKKLNTELRAIDQVNDFVNYALTQRKINKLQEMLDNEIKLFRKTSMKLTMYIKFLYKSMLVLLSIYLIWNYKSKPIVDFTMLIHKNETLVDSTTGTIFYPFDFIFSFPNFTLTNSIGVTIWLFILNRFMDIFYNKINFLFKPKIASKVQEPVIKLNEDIELD